MNANTISGYFGGTGRNQIASQTLATATETEIKVNTDASSAIALLTIPQGTAIAGSTAPLDFSDNAALLNRTGRTWGRPVAAGQPAHNTKSFDSGRPFMIRWAGVITPASNAANSLQLIIYNGTSKSGTAIASTGVQTGTETSTQAGSFIIETRLQWDVVSGLLGGQFWYQYLGGATPFYNTWATNTAAATGVTLATLNFCASVKWGNAVGGVCATSEFSLEQK
jgi:hypothetical protein